MRNRSNALPVLELKTLAPVLAVGACLFAASPTLAQQARPGEVMGLRYLTWAGKPDAPTPNATDGLRRSNAAGPPTPLAANAPRYPGIQSASARPSRYGVGSGAGLTPASAWTGSSRAPAPAPVPLAAPQEAPRGPIPVYSAPQQAQVDPAEQARAQAAYQAEIQAQYQAWYQSAAQAQYEAQVRAMPQPQQQAVHVQAPAADQAQTAPQFQQRADAGPAPASVSAHGYDPMAPRRDAPIFRMQQPQAPAQSEAQPQQAAAVPAASTQANAQGEIQSPVLTQPVAGRTTGGQAYAGAEPPREGVRYYSVQRAVGRQPDPIAIPESVYLDNAPIDLAEPPAAPVRTRTVNGQAQVVVPNQDPNLP
ncbi:hypothetical protein [Brevundimonas goettingensis]|uniref:Uncharacterized protein n=1 Tax=Brevundimonas goettingensis TaxID=2774190 RepID=A0A975C2D3_9CAUL|nr:hypothetical protein [Brevundimonas goettingensis]QTC91577.1 hypothetical protein IFJ75_01160 [Brevundimonas goettingensis]